MWAKTYWPQTYWQGRYWPPVVGGVIVLPLLIRSCVDLPARPVDIDLPARATAIDAPSRNVDLDLPVIP